MQSSTRGNRTTATSKQNTKQTSSTAASSKAGSGSTIDAAALQDHWIRNLGLGGIGRRKTSDNNNAASYSQSSTRNGDNPSTRGGKKPRSGQRLNTTGHRNPSKKRQDEGSIHTKPEYQKWECEECEELNHVSSEVCRRCKTRRPSRILKKPEKKTLAQMRGLVAGPPPKLTDQEWKQVESLSLHRRDPDQGCPICMDNFGLRETLILSCSHTFHRKCLESFEKFSELPSKQCPVCRHPHYEKKEFLHAASHHREMKAKQIQSVIRMALARKKYAAIRREYYRAGKGDISMRRRYYAESLENVQKRWNTNLHQRTSEIDRLLSESDSNIAAVRMSVEQNLNHLEARRSRTSTQQANTGPSDIAQSQSLRGDEREMGEVDLSAFSSDIQESMAAPNVIVRGDTATQATRKHRQIGDTWKDPLIYALKRLNGYSSTEDENCCPICICTLETGQLSHTDSNTPLPAKKLSLLSCSHVFHEACLASFEAFASPDAPPACPICRQHYHSENFHDVCNEFPDLAAHYS